MLVEGPKSPLKGRERRIMARAHKSWWRGLVGPSALAGTDWSLPPRAPTSACAAPANRPLRHGSKALCHAVGLEFDELP